ncbi:unnamed protein product [Moneuplotes crassus]|uniref:Uncharacterized protein n=1 Tax=Euplotes crassus TaxID=5936 RepID=A0AAD1UNJ6_EUPCR|nr:unnamed protein product [Moneuplotes crassus]
MSIYSGFATRQQEGFYNKITLRVMEMISDRLIAFVRADPFDEESWYSHLRKIYKYMEVMERQKYLDPKFSHGIKKLIKVYKNHLNITDNSTITSRSFYLNNNIKDYAHVNMESLQEKSIKEGSEERDPSQENHISTSGNSSKIHGEKNSDLKLNNEILVRNNYSKSAQSNPKRILKQPINTNSFVKADLNVTKKEIIIDHEKTSVNYKLPGNTPEMNIQNHSKQTHNTSYINSRFHEDLVQPNTALPAQIIQRKGRRIRKIKLQKNCDIYGQGKTCKNRSNIRSVPRHFSRKRGGRIKLNQSMADANLNNYTDTGAVLAASCKRKNKYERIQKSSKTSKFKIQLMPHSKRSNSVNSHRPKRRSSSRRRSMTRFLVRKKFNKSGSHIRGNRYIKNILPTVRAGDDRGMIAQQFGSYNKS